MNFILKGFAGELIKMAQDEPVFVDTSAIPYEPNLIPGDISTLNPIAASGPQVSVGELGTIETPRETIDRLKYNHWYRSKT